MILLAFAQTNQEPHRSFVGMSATKKQIRELRPYLIGDAKPNHEWDAFCPLHEDEKRSMSLNTETGEWYCFAGCGGGGVAGLIKQKENWLPPPSAASLNGHAHKSRNGNGQIEIVSNAHVSGWHSNLMSNGDRLEYLHGRGIDAPTIEQYIIGWDSSRHVYTIPVYGPKGELWNVRRYNPNPPINVPKIRSVTGMGSPRLYPLSILDGADDYIIIGEGEWDTLATIQRGFPMITRTASADTWKAEWSELFKGMRVYLAHDADHKGQTANQKVARALHRTAEIYTIKLPYPISEKHGKDLTDYWRDYTAVDFKELLAGAERYGPKKKNQDPEVVTVIDSYDANMVGEPVKIDVTIKGRREPGYTVPHTVNLSCTRDVGAKCNFCPLNAAGGEASFVIKPNNPRILALLDVNQNTVLQNIAAEFGVPGSKCSRLVLEATKHQAIEILLARPSLDSADGRKADSYKGIKITSVGRHDTLPNNTMQITGALYPDPRTQTNEFLAWEMERTETSVDHFEVTKEAIALMKIFQTRKRPLLKLRHISDQLAAHVTHIVGRPEMHALMDLTFHSALGFTFSHRFESRGWLDALIIGDTRTGKSEAAAGLVKHYGVGEIIGGEMASVAGIIGGAQQLSGKNDWMITWGAMPLNDRRLVVLDEASGLSHEDISNLSDVRGSGVARITKIVSEAAHARARMLWLSNPRNAKMSDFTYGVDAIRPLIGNNEDIARFDLAMSVSQGDVSASIINRPPKGGTLAYPSIACHTLILWVWTRQPDQIIWAGHTEQAILDAANDMGKRYVEDPPLIQAANIRLKIARVAVALAARLFSTDDSYQNVVVKPEHVTDAVEFMDRIYRMGTFGYAERSLERIAARDAAIENVDEIREFINQRPGLATFLRSQPKFRRQDLEEVLDISRQEANTVINTLWEARMVRKDLADLRIEPTLHKLLRELA